MVASVTALSWLVLVACSMGDGCAALGHDDLLKTVLFDTGFGNVWLVRLGLMALLIASVTLSDGYGSRNVVIVSALVVGSLGLIGHAAMESGAAGLLRVLNHAAHVTTAGLWVGGLVALASVLSLGRPMRVDDAAFNALRRFSGMGHAVVALVIATGAINTWFILGSLWINRHSYYQVMLLTKVVLVIAMVITAIINRYVLMPRFARSSYGSHLLYRNTLLEVFLGLLAIGLVSYFATLEPV